jgi:TP901 family phage tail tape measure protein
MGEREQYLVAVVGADITQFRQGMRDVRKELGVLDESSSQSLARLGRTLTYTLTAPLLAVGTAMVGTASNFDASMRNINSIANLSESEFHDLSAAVLDFGKTTRGGAQMASEALYTIYSAGISGALAFDIMEVSTLTAEAGLSDITTTAEALTASMLAYGFTTEQEAMRASNALTRMVQVGVGDMNSFAGSIATFTPSSSILGVTIEEAFALNARLTQMGYSASESAVRVNAAMRSLIKPSEAMSAALGKLGVGSAEELIQKYGGLTESLIALQGTTDGTAEGLAELFSDTRALQGVIQITKDVDATRKTIADFNKGLDTATMDAWTQQTKSFAYQFDLAKSAVQALAISLGSALLPILTPLIQSFTGFILGLTEMDAGTRTLVVTVGLLAAALPPLLWLFASMISPFGAIIAGVVAVKHAFDSNFMGIADTVKKFAADVTTALAPVTSVVEDFIKLAFGDAAIDPGSIMYEDGSSMIGAPMDFGVIQATATISYTVEEGDTLWDIWTTNFKDKYANFGDFVTATGLDAKAIIQPGQVINVGGSSQAISSGISTLLTSGVNMGLADALADESLGHMTAPTNFWERIAWAITSTKDNFTAALDEALVTLQPVVDDFGGKLLTQIAGAFDTEGSTGNGDTGLYGGLVSSIDGIGGALGGDLATTFPGITAGITTLVTNVGDWLLKEGVPTISRAAGYFAGQVGVLIGKGLSAVWGMITTGGSGGTDAVGEAVIDPFLGGINDAMADNGVTNIGDTIVTGLTGSIGLAILAKTVLFTGVATAFQGALNLAFLAVKWEFAALAQVGSLIWASFSSSVLAPAGAWAASIAAGVWASLATALGGIVTAISGFFATTILPVLTTALATLGATFVAAPVTVSLAVLATVGALLWKPLSDMWDSIPGAREWAQSWADDLQNKLNESIANRPVNLVVDKITSSEAWKAKFGGELDVELAPTSTLVTTAPGFWDNVMTGIATPAAGIELNPAVNMLSAPVSLPVGYTKPLVTALGDAVTTAALDPEVLASIDTATVGMMTAWGDSMGTALADGAITQEEIETSITQPLYDALFPVIGEGGTVRLMWTGLVADILTAAQSIGESVTVLAQGVPQAFAFMVTTSTPLLDALILKFGQVEVAANTMAAALGGLSGIVINPNVPLPTVVPVNPAVGTPDDLTVETEGAMPAMPADLLESTNVNKGGDSFTEQSIVVNGAVTANEVIKVLEARGYKLVRK